MRFAAVLLLLCALAPARAAELVDPPPVAVPEGLAPLLVEKAVRLALAEQRWSVQGEAPGELIADYSPRRHVARVRILHDAARVQIVYQSSVNLDFEERDGRRVIHRAYSDWVGELAGAIHRHLRRSDLSAAPGPAPEPVPAVAAPPPPAITPLVRAIAPGEPLHVSAITPYDEGVGSADMRRECHWNAQLPGHVAAYSKLNLVPVPDSRQNATGLSLDITVIAVHATGGGGFGGVKWGRIRAVLRDGEQTVGSTDLYRDSAGGGSWSACGAMERIGKALAKDLGRWLLRPAPTLPVGG